MAISTNRVIPVHFNIFFNFLIKVFPYQSSGDKVWFHDVYLPPKLSLDNAEGKAQMFELLKYGGELLTKK